MLSHPTPHPPHHHPFSHCTSSGFNLREGSSPHWLFQARRRSAWSSIISLYHGKPNGPWDCKNRREFIDSRARNRPSSFICRPRFGAQNFQLKVKSEDLVAWESLSWYHKSYVNCGSFWSFKLTRTLSDKEMICSSTETNAIFFPLFSIFWNDK